MKTLYHTDVAKAAFSKYLSPRALDWLIRGNFNTDFYGSLGWKILEHNVVPFRGFGRKWYKSIDHLDQCKDYDMLVSDWKELHRRLGECADDEKYPPKKIKKLLIALGRVSHSMTDLYAHSTYVELLYSYYRNEPAAAEALAKSGKSIGEYIAENGPIFSQVISDTDGKYEVFVTKYLRPHIFSDECIPDTGPRSHDEINKDSPDSKMSNHPEYPDMFKAVMALAHWEVVKLVSEFFDELKTRNLKKYEILTAAMPGAFEAPGIFERRAIFWSKKFGGYD